jgi:glycosidase
MRNRLAAGLACSWLVLGCAGGQAGGGDGGAASDASGPGTIDGGGEDGGPADAGPPACGTCQVDFAFPAAGVTSCELHGNFAPDGWSQGVGMTRVGDHFAASLELPHGRTVQYKFVVDGAWLADPQGARVGDGQGGENSALVVDCGCGGPIATSFDWHDAVMYMVLVDRFLDGDHANDSPLLGVEPAANFAGGDLAGLKQKIDAGYFDALGVNVLWISAPIDNADGTGAGDDGHLYTSYHGYWPRDLTQVESRVGDLAALIALTDAAHRRGMRVVMDYVMNHVHIESPLFAQHPEWFWPLSKDGHQCVCGDGCSWDAPEGLRCWFRSYLPDFDFQNADARRYSVGNAIEWIQRAGLDGLRLDAVKHIETSWITDLRARIAHEVEFGGKRFYLVGETYTGDKGLIRQYVDPATMLDGQFDFPLRAEVARVLLGRHGAMSDLEGFLAANDGFYGAGAVMSTFLGNHDLPRAIHLAEDAPLFSEWDSGKARSWTNLPTQPTARAPYERLALGFALLMTLPGVPLVYYGDEIGLAGGGDPDNRRLMPWSGTSADQDWLRTRLGKLAHVRAAHPALRRGTRAGEGASNDVLVYRMSDGGETLHVALNRSDAAAAVPGLPAGDYRDLVSDSDVSAGALLPARTAWILVPR